MSNDPYAYGAERAFVAAATVPPGTSLEGPIAAARAKCYEQCDEWGLASPHRIGLFRFSETWEVRERGATWMVTFKIAVRVVNIDETITLPGDWSYQSNAGFSE